MRRQVVRTPTKLARNVKHGQTAMAKPEVDG
jgi:hypothetical protein